MKQLVGLFGHPIGHSLSPVMHNTQYERLQIPYTYHAFDVEPDRLKEAVEAIRALRLRGVNVTVPHKVDVMDYLDDIEEEAKQIGAVNTIVNDDGMLKGYNTDGRGYLLSLTERIGDDLSDKHVLVVGAGGAARAVAVSLSRHGIGQLTIANRTVTKAEVLVDLCQGWQSTEAKTIEQSEKCMDEYDIIIQTTSVGMSPNTNEQPMSLQGIRPGVLVSDLIYNPLKTKWLQEADNLGAEVLDGVGMFVYQGALAIEYWTGEKPDTKLMRQQVIESLGGK
ncbi:shikimate dehydrogenase [Texcoconibacillus texcoconensis]|uniref:Shikimate dehydrogenase (NADP(+)) n=1 Tax=Texcoconibacillus texcoconensis TaxID=1095777 RepID=A0A840QR88_9BACI|nr:shikimate dehydrogenase [Texcoconibacillus texcoconensis]MBB5173972.1 shikimate dehydrogenase [Texcoconibacillus texcoconensis]